MWNDTLAFAAMGWLLTLAATYLVHSSVLLVGTLVALRFAPTTSHVLAERMWKFAAIAGVLTSVLQVTTWNASSAVHFQVEMPSAELVYESATAKESRIEVAPETELQATGDSGRVRRDRSVVSNLQPFAATAAIDASISPDSLRSTSDALPEAFDNNNLEGPSTPLSFRLSESKTISNNSTPVNTEFVEIATQSDVQEPQEDSNPTNGDDTSASRADLNPRPAHASVSVIVTVSVLVLAVAFGILRLALLNRRFRHQLRGFRVLETGVAHLCLKKLAAKTKLRKRIVLLESSLADEPMAFGVFRWHIVIPHGVEDSLANDELRALLAHEVAHLVRGDGCWLWIGRVLCSCLTIQPLNILARRRWQSAGEYQCDAWAVEHLVKPLALARCLTSVAEWKIGRRAALIGLSVAGNRSALTDRIERLTARTPVADPWRLPLRRRMQLSVGSGVFVLLAVFGPRCEFADGLNPQLHADDFDDGNTPTQFESPDIKGTRRTEPYNASDIANDLQDPNAIASRLIQELDQLRGEAGRLDERIQGQSTDPVARDLGSHIRERSASLSERGKHLVERLSNAESQH